MIALFVAVAGLFTFRHGAWTPMRVSGALVCVAAMAMLSVARIQLGRSFAVRARAQELVTAGIYSRIRNPIYVAGEVFFAGLALFLPSWMPVAIIAVTTPIQIMRARREAAVLHAAFGEQYEAYRASTWF